MKIVLPVTIVLLFIGALYTAWSIAFFFKIPSGALLMFLSGLIIFFFGVVSDQISILVRRRKE
jgi:nitrogen fixation-related uncharacterized protein